MKSLNVMLKPASGLCNLRCRYCFYTDEMQKRETASFGIMREAVLEIVLRKALEAATERCTIAFQGGEPALAGLPFFENAVCMAARHNINGCAVSFALQTNGLLLNSDWCRFLAQNNFLVGLSLDGTKELHDANRVDADGAGTFERAMGAARLLQQHRVEFNILTVVTAATGRHFREINNFFERNRLRYQQYIPCLDPLEEARGAQPWSLTPKGYEQYLKTAFDCWYENAMKGRQRYHRYFDNLLCMLDGRPPEACGMSGRCGVQYVVEADGSVYPCDFYMLDRYRLGNLVTDSWEQIDARLAEIAFVEQSLPTDAACAKCRWFALCRGGCRRDRDYFENGIGRNYFCASYHAFFEYAYPRLERLYRKLSENNDRHR